MTRKTEPLPSDSAAVRTEECAAIRTANRKTDRARRGFTLVELLAAMVIAAMSAAVAAESLSFALSYYQARTGETEAQLLCETICLLLQDDLTQKSPEQVASDIANGVYEPINGEAPALSGIKLPSACYGPRNSTLRRVETIQVEQVGTDNLFRVSVTVSTVGGHSSGTSFTVTPLG